MLTDKRFVYGPLLNFTNGWPIIHLMVHVESNTIFPIDKSVNGDSVESKVEHREYRLKAYKQQRKSVPNNRITFLGDQLARPTCVKRGRDRRPHVEFAMALPQNTLNFYRSLRHLAVVKKEASAT